MIGLENLSLCYLSQEPSQKAQNFVLKDTTFFLKQNSINLLFGASGAGKTTILRLLANIPNSACQITSGNVFFGEPVGFVFQKPNLLPWASVLDNVALPLFDTVGKKEARQIASDFLQKVSMFDLKKRFPSEISGGQAQRVSLARAFAWIFSKPLSKKSLLLMDEPFQSQDIAQKNKLDLLLQELLQTYPCTVLMVSHDTEQISLADIVFLLDANSGRITYTTINEKTPTSTHTIQTAIKEKLSQTDAKTV